MWKLTTPTVWAHAHSPAEWARHHVKVVVTLLVLAVVFSYPAGIFFTVIIKAALEDPVETQTQIPARTIRGFGIITSANDAIGTVSLQHAAIPELQLGEATTSFRAVPEIIKQSAVGDRVTFTLSDQGGVYVITEVSNRTSGVVVK